MTISFRRRSHPEHQSVEKYSLTHHKSGTSRFLVETRERQYFSLKRFRVSSWWRTNAESHQIASVEFDPSCSTRIGDCGVCGVGRFYALGHRVSGGVLASGSVALPGDVYCPGGCGDVVFPRRESVYSDPNVLAWMWCQPLAVMRDRESDLIRSHEEVTRFEDALERSFIRREEIENAKRFSMLEALTKEEGK